MHRVIRELPCCKESEVSVHQGLLGVGLEEVGKENLGGGILEDGSGYIVRSKGDARAGGSTRRIPGGVCVDA